MEPFPFSDEYWERIRETTLGLVNSTFARDDLLHASLFEHLRSLLEVFRGKYGSHPMFPEIEADFTDDPKQRIGLYREAVGFAVAAGLPTYTIRISLARVLLEEADDPESALAELLACRVELRVHADSSEKKEWHELHEACRKLGI